MTGMPAPSAAVRSAVMFSMHCAAQGVGAGDVEQVHAHARGVEAHGVADRVVDDVAEGLARRLLAVDVGDVDAQHERGLRRGRGAPAAAAPGRARAGSRRAAPPPASRPRAACPRCRRGSAARRRTRGRRRRRCSGPTWRGRGGSGGRRRTRADHRHGRRRGSAWKDHAAVVIAGPNLTIDRTLSIDELRPGEVLRFERAVVTPGGKGVNVARVARAARRGRACSSASFRGGPGRRGRRCWPTRGSPCAASRSAASCARPRWCSSARAA